MSSLRAFLQPFFAQFPDVHWHVTSCAVAHPAEEGETRIEVHFRRYGLTSAVMTCRTNQPSLHHLQEGCSVSAQQAVIQRAHTPSQQACKSRTQCHALRGVRRTWTAEDGVKYDRAGKEWICVGNDDLLITRVHVAAMEPSQS